MRFLLRPGRGRAGSAPATLPERHQLCDASYDAATLAFLHLHERIDTLPADMQSASWQRVTRTLSGLPDPDLAEALGLD